MSDFKAVGEILITEEQIRARAAEIGAQISEEFRGEEILAVGILKGALPWMADILKNIDNEKLIMDFMVCSSYGSGTTTTGDVKIVKNVDFPVEGRNVLIIEDIVDSGITLSYLKKYFQSKHAKSIRICTLLDKKSGRKVELEADYVGFPAPDKFIVGYGLDFDQRYRQLPYISWLKENE